jgi:hypothetical protein
MMGFHSVIDNPDPVSRVTPPNNICMIIIATPAISHIATGLEERWGKGWIIMAQRYMK